MDKPHIADYKSKPAELQSGEAYFWCACGLSKNGQFCDGSHRSSPFKPMKFIAEKTGTAPICMCKATKNPPFCDGSHRNLEKSTPEKEQAVSTVVEPHVNYIHALAKDGLSAEQHGPIDAMGVPAAALPKWDDIQIITAQLHKKPLMEDSYVETQCIIGKNAKKPLVISMPLFVSDMSFGALSEQAKLSMAKGAELAGTGICSGEGGMLPEEQQSNQRYLYEMASAKFGFNESDLEKVQAFHFKAGQAAKTGTGGHLPGNKVQGRIAQIRGLQQGQDAISPPAFSDLTTTNDYKNFSDHVRSLSGGIPIGFKISAQHIEKDINFAVEAGADYIILDGRGGGTGAAPLLFRDHISIPSIVALARARKHLDSIRRQDITLIITGGLRTPADFIKALALGADAVAIANSAMQAMGCVAARICNTNLCPVGIATQDPKLTKLIDIGQSAKKLANFLKSSNELMQIMARACGHSHLQQFSPDDLTVWKKDMAELTGIAFSGVK